MSLESPPSSQPTAQTGSDVNNSQPTGSSPSGNTDAKSTETLLDRFQKTVDSSGEENSSDSEKVEEGKPDGSPSDPATEKKPGGEGEQEGEVSEDELKTYSVKTQRRIKKLLNERNETRGQLEAIKPQAEAFARIETFIKEAGLSKSEVNEGFEVMRLMKHEPQKALEALTSYITRIQSLLGEVLPDDLQQKVNQGIIDEQTAKEMAKLRAGHTAAQQRLQQTEEQRQTEAREVLANSVGKAIEAKERSLKTSDPDYQKLFPFVKREIALLLGQKVPETVEDAEKIFDTAVENVRKELSSFRPRQQANRVPQGGSQPTNLPAPSSMLEAMKQSVGR